MAGGDPSADINHILQTEVSRRDAIKLGAAAVASTVLTGLGVKTAAENLFTSKEITFLDLREGKLVLSEKPVPVKVKFVPLQDPTSRMWNDENIVLRYGGPNFTNESGANIRALSPQAIKTEYAVRVLGATFSGSPYGDLKIDDQGKERTGGEWFMLTKENGQPVDPSGSPLAAEQKPYFVAANFVTVTPPQPLAKK